jgi:hypothetical protein
MPYITTDRKADLIQHTALGINARTKILVNAGELNFVLTSVVLDYIDTKGLKYQTINDILGALECAKAEFYRRVAAPYEDKKIKENGDVY